MTAAAGTQAAFDDDLRARALAPFWEVVDRNPAPRPVTVPHRWPWAEVEPLLRQAGELVSTAEAERRVLMYVNPATPGDKRAVGNLYAGIQLILPGESARAHRHTAAALRFVLEGAGALTTVGGTPVQLERFDLVLTPGWEWHDHVNTSDDPMAWLDALDSPLTRALDAWFFEPHPDGMQPVARGTSAGTGTSASTPLSYPWAAQRAALDAALDRSATGAAVVDYHDPVTGADVLPTTRCRAIGVAPGGRLGPVRRVGAAVYCVVEGRGLATIGDTAFALSFGDVFCVPSWYPLAIQSDDSGGEVLRLFAYDDEPVLRALGLARSEGTL